MIDVTAMRDDWLGVIEGMGDGVIVAREDGDFVVFNPAAERILGFRRCAGLSDGAWMASFVAFSPNGRRLSTDEDPLARALRGEPADQQEILIRAPGRDPVWVSVTARPITLSGGERGAVATFRDAARGKRRSVAAGSDNSDFAEPCSESYSETKGHTAEVRAMSALIDHLSTGVLFEDASKRVTLVNRAFCRFFGYSDPSAIVGSGGNDDRRTPAVRDRDAYERVRNRRMDERITALSDRVELIDGRVLERDYVPVSVEGVIEGHFWCFRDVTERERARAQLAELSNRDDLTALYNRRGFITLAEQWLRIASRTRRTPLLLFVDVNGMKLVNDRLGHATGDRVLRDTADLIRTTFRESDILARLGGDEFVVLAVDATPEHATLLSERLQRNVQVLNDTVERPYKLSVSVGVAAWDPAKPRSIEELLAEADARMYEEKRRRLAKSSIRATSSV